jgi:hypothetical protein
MDCTNDSDLNNADRRELVVILMEGSHVYNCYTRRDFRKILTAEYEKAICEYDLRFLEQDMRFGTTQGKKLSAPVFKEPYFGVFVDKSIVAFQDHDCLLLYNPRPVPVYSAFAQSAIHGSEVNLYSVYPLSLAYFLEWNERNRGSGRVQQFVSGVVGSITPEVKERLIRDVDFILRGGDANFIGEEYRTRVAQDIRLKVAVDYPALQHAQELEEARVERERARAQPVQLGPRMSEAQQRAQR